MLRAERPKNDGVSRGERDCVRRRGTPLWPDPMDKLKLRDGFAAPQPGQDVAFTRGAAHEP